MTRSIWDTLSGNGNFCLKPNGVFFIAKNGNPGICTTDDFKNKKEIKFATQSGPLLLIDGEIHQAFSHLWRGVWGEVKF